MRGRTQLAGAGRRYRQVRKLWREGGGTAVWRRVCQGVAAHIAPVGQTLPVLACDVLAADLTLPRTWPAMRKVRSGPMTLNWVTSPPAEGSGGHTTMFRLIQHLERSGHQCRIYLYDVFGHELRDNQATIQRLFPALKAPVADVRNGMAPADAIFATSWPTAYPVYNDPCAGKRFYLVQDFEPWFYPVGGLSALAENTYRMGFSAVTAGCFLANKLAAEYGMRTGAFSFGCDTQKYHLLDGTKRDGVVFYAKPGAARRAFEVGIMALQLLVRNNPGVVVHLYGESIADLPFRAVVHGIVRPEKLNEIYNRCFAGLSLSMSNVSLVPHEMLAAGCIPVVNDAPHNRVVLDNDYVRYSAASPHALARAMENLLNDAAYDRLAKAASASVAHLTWDDAGIAVERFIRDELSSNDAQVPALATNSVGPRRADEGVLASETK